jgi:hypothetical protein
MVFRKILAYKKIMGFGKPGNNGIWEYNEIWENEIWKNKMGYGKITGRGKIMV